MNRTRHESAATRGPRSQVLLFVCAAGVVLFNFPLLMVWDSPATVLGLPLLPVALFTIWAGLIVVLAIVCERAPRRDMERLTDHPPADAPTADKAAEDVAILGRPHKEPGDGRTA
ncbi:MAG: hypothetical protein AB7E29_10270 [Xanthobacter sp.]